MSSFAGSAHASGESTYGVDQSRANENDNTIRMNGGNASADPFASPMASDKYSAVGGKRRKKSNKNRKGKKGGVGLGEVAVPALLVYANNAFGRGRRSVRLNPMSHFSKKSMRRNRGSRGRKRMRGSRRR